MEHRAFLFDTEKYHAEIEQMILDAGSRGDAAALEQYIDAHLRQCYDPEADLGLGEDWETLCGAMEELDLSGGTEYYFIGEEIRAGNFVLDPSGMGMGIIEPDNIELIYDELDGAAPDLEANDDELLSELYRSLMEIYETARVHSKGLLMTF